MKCAKNEKSLYSFFNYRLLGTSLLMSPLKAEFRMFMHSTVNSMPFSTLKPWRSLKAIFQGGLNGWYGNGPKLSDGTSGSSEISGVNISGILIIVGDICEHEDRCHRSVLRRLLIEAGADVLSSYQLM